MLRRCAHLSFFLILFHLHLHSSCPSCQRYFFTLHQIGSLAQVFYNGLADANLATRRFLPPAKENALYSLDAATQPFLDHVDEFIHLFEEATFLPLSSTFPCKVNTTTSLSTEKSLFFRAEELQNDLQTIVETMTSKPSPTISGNVPQELTLTSCLRALQPPQDFASRLAAAFAHLSGRNEFEEQKRELFAFYENVSSRLSFAFQYLATLHKEITNTPTRDLCRSRRNSESLADLQPEFDTLVRSFQLIKDTISRATSTFLHQRQDKEIRSLVETIHYSAHRPVLTSDGKPVALIEGDPSHTVFIKVDDETFLYRQEKFVWDPQTKKHVRKIILQKLILDPVTDHVLHPDKLRGFPRPQCVYVTFADLYETIQNHLNVTNTVLKALHQSVA